ncbi:hypothetical protein FS837_000715 [Tulasnella sp. UAMH 9824]|nr:hypothetical protein FS837_000715 [Tulasnella sp. UAMH 9824]
MKLLTVIFSLLTAMVLVPTAVSRPSITDPTTRPAFLGKRHSIGQASPVSPQPDQLDTNAKRFANDLPPLPPSKSRRYKASPVRRTGASPVPVPPVTCTSCSGVIEVYNTNTGDRIGYISSNGYYNVLYQVQATLSSALRVHFTIPSGATGTVTDLNIVADNSKLNNAASAPYVGLAAGAYSGLVSNGAEPARMVGTPQLAARSLPVTGTNSWGNYKIESAVWTINLSTWDLTLKWLNPNNSLAPGVPFSSNGAILFGDKGYWVSTNPNLTILGLSFKFALV